MKYIYFWFPFSGFLLGTLASLEAADIQLSGKKDRVLQIQVRAEVLDTSKAFLDLKEDSFLASVEEIQNPYFVKEEEVAPEPTATVADTVKEPEPEPEVVPVVYEDASVLKAVAVSFAKQVRGTLARGSVNYLQLQGGGMIKAGTSFPAKIPEVEDQSFTVTISEIHSRGYTLKLGDATLEVSLGQSSGATKDNTK